MLVSEFDYELPPDLIAQQPAAERGASRLLHLDAQTGTIRDLKFSDLPSLVGPEDLLVLNDTRVIKARLHGHKATGGKVEVLVERIEGSHEVLALARTGHALHPGYRLTLGDGALAEVQGREGDLYRLRFDEEVAAVLERCGEVPLPPYIRHAPGAQDEARYQTVYAAQPGAVAAPTAGLHFDQAMLDRIAARGAGIARLTLHVGAGTFQPVRGDVVEEHRMHSERYEVPEDTLAALPGRRVLAVGTTSLRALESAVLTGKRSGDTDLFITPGFRFHVVRRLLTNFHLPKSTLLMLVSAFAGTENIRRAYAHAIAQQYRFFSYGDAMLIERAP
ncbi:MAG: tRNA preQ1(34) S-adenosylmethionine ribosyltransferase-isomerase QueA [Gammaproteobacteria bacterium]|nr:tRNA preQ1(34) S-adenosylmethionine ribosyltransferase-isomerase QueA [Gammaproteobacteria bacterium]